jgi:hypothetical protein
MSVIINPGSFRDPAGFVYSRNGTVFRQINQCYSEEFDAVRQSGLLEHLQARNALIHHKEMAIDQNSATAAAYRIIRPEPIPFISYSHEWSFSQLKDAALLTLEIQQESLLHGFVLKDASAFNIQFLRGKPIFIDTLSFERYRDGEPWVAYGQFCRHFLGPLALMCYVDISLSQMLRVHLDGIPLHLATRLLPFPAYFNAGLLIHLFLHSRTQQKYAPQGVATFTRNKTIRSVGKINATGLLGIVESLKNTVSRLQWKPTETEWSEYYSTTNYTKAAFQNKKEIVENILNLKKPKTVWAIGANDGLFSRIASQKGSDVVSLDSDPGAVEKNYLLCKSSNETGIVPIMMDITNPTSGFGWMNTERYSLFQRGSADMVFALAIIHHLAIGNNLPFKMIAELFQRVCTFLLIEFVPKSDSQVKFMLSSRRDIFGDYSEACFLAGFQDYFKVECRMPVIESERVIFLMRKRDG